MHCFRQSGEETFIIVVNYDYKALILSKKNERFSCFHLAKFLLENKTPFSFGIGLLENCRTDCNQNLPSQFSTSKLTTDKRKTSFHRISLMFLLIKLLFVHFGRYLLIASMDFRTAYIIRKPFVCILFSEVIVEVLTSSFEKSSLT